MTLLAASLSLTGSPRQEPPQVEFRTDVRMIRLDVSVVGKHGVPVAGLLPQDFEVYEDGRRVELSLFEAFEAAAAAAAAGDPAGEALSRPPRRLILLIDTGLMTLSGLHRARQSAERFLQRHTSDGDWVRVINRATGQAWGGLMPEDRNQLVSVVRNISWRRTGAWGASADDLTAPIVDRIDTGFDSLGGPSASTSSEVFLSQFAQTSGLLGLLEAILVQLSGIEGRKAVVLISPGFPRLRDLDRRLEDVSTLARQAATPIYFVDSRAMDDLVAAPTPGRRLQSAFGMTWARSGGAEELAEVTGGFTSRFSNSLTPALSRVAAEMRTYYVLGYHPIRPDDGRFRKLKIKVKVDGVKARTKKGYLAGRRRR